MELLILAVAIIGFVKLVNMHTKPDPLDLSEPQPPSVVEPFKEDT